MRRPYIYPHRSLRFVPIPATRVIVGVAAAVVLCAVTAFRGTDLLVAHARLCGLLLRLAGIPVEGTQTIGVFGGLGPVDVPVTPVLTYEGHLLEAAVLLISSVLLLVVVYRYISLARNFVLCLLTLVVASALVIFFNPSFQISSPLFTKIWLRGEILIWLLLPWVSTFLFVPVHSTALGAVLWVLGMQAYAYLWSAVRLTFCLGVAYYTGTLFLLLLWFSLGVLADLLYILVFYSVVVHQACGRWGRRALWQY